MQNQETVFHLRIWAVINEAAVRLREIRLGSNRDTEVALESYLEIR